MGLPWALLGSSCGPLGALLVAFWGPLGPFLGRLGALLGPIGALLGRLGALLGASQAVMGASWAVLDAVQTKEANILKMYVFRREFDNL